MDGGKGAGRAVSDASCCHFNILQERAGHAMAKASPSQIRLSFPQGLETVGMAILVA